MVVPIASISFETMVLKLIPKLECKNPTTDMFSSLQIRTVVL